jgi:hypothetical protein
MRVLWALFLICACGGSQGQPVSSPEPEKETTTVAAPPAQEDPYGQGPPREIVETPQEVDLPAVPSFELKKGKKGFPTVRELRVQGEPYLDSEVVVSGFVIDRYDCARALAGPGISRAEVRRILRDEPERCQRPNFYLGATADAPRERGVWVVEVPRHPRPDEKKSLPRDVLDNWPKVPRFKVGDRVEIRGTWATRSPRGFMSSEGLLIYKSLKHLK